MHIHLKALELKKQKAYPTQLPAHQQIGDPNDPNNVQKAGKELRYGEVFYILFS